MLEENPYATPQTLSNEFPDAPRPFGWEVIGKVVRVKQSSQFPMIDPFTGRSADSMTLFKKMVRYRPRWLWLFPIIGGVCFLQNQSNHNTVFYVSNFLLGMLLGWLFSRIVGLFFPNCTLRLFFEKQTMRRRNAISKILSLLLLVGFFGGLALPQRMNWIAGYSLIAWLFAHLICSSIYRGLRCSRKSDGLFEIRGFHPKALAELARECQKETVQIS
ncbi:MAG: hypothetical protein H8M99_00260 [Gloeobacteraceae cyanobacterium ES-bin-144]|nr:hypothetical protein [Verrucomicrobiales bacterium]